MSPQRRAGLLLVAGIVLFLVGFAVVLVPGSDASFGWFAYAPLASTDLLAGLLYFETTRWGSAVVGVVGLVAAGWAAGFLAGRRAR